MKFLKRLFSNYQVWNFFFASVLVGVTFGVWKDIQSPQSSLQDSQTLQEQVEIQNAPSPDHPSLSSPNTQNQEIDKSTSLPSETPPPPLSNNFSTANTTSEQSNPNSSSANNNNTTQWQSSPDLSSNESAVKMTDKSSLEQPVVLSKSNLSQNQNNSYFGHFPYQQAPSQRLVEVEKYYYRMNLLDIEAAEAFKRMKADAKAQGVELILISGFRSIPDQEKLFQKQIQRRGSKEAAAKLSAPPGYSEHHTGYAMDLGDGKQPNTDLKFQFESTQAYQWLVANAYKYGFELSFPRNNPQGVSFEPWHWRYVMSEHSNQIFSHSRF